MHQMVTRLLFLLFNIKFLIYFLTKFSQGMIPEGRSFSDTPEGIKCLDCAKVTNHGHQGPKKGADTSALKPVDSSTDGHPSGRDHVCAKVIDHLLQVFSHSTQL